MAVTTNTEVAENTYVYLTFGDPTYVNIGSVLVIGRTDFEFREQGYNTAVYAWSDNGQ